MRRKKEEEGSERGSQIAALRYLPRDYFRPLSIADIFPRAAPLEIDIGCGDGTFLVAMAKRHPERNFLGVERLLGRLHASARKAVAAGLGNVRLLRVESGYTVQYLLPPGSVSRFYVLFADPWPKRRHWPRRLLQPAFLEHAAAALAAGGDLCIKTDDREYFQFIESVARACPLFHSEPWEEAKELPLTDFEIGFVARGLPIHSLRLTKISHGNAGAGASGERAGEN